MFGRNARLPADLLFSTDRPRDLSPGQYALQLHESLEEAFENVRAHMGTRLAQQKLIYDQRVHGNPLQPNTLVWLHSTVIPPGGSRKLHHPWPGPWQVLKRISDATYRIQDSRNKRKRLIVHFNRLKPVAPGTRLDEPTELLPPLPDEQAPNDSELPYQLVDDDAPPNPAPVLAPPPAPRYPARTRRPPDYLMPT